MSEQGATALAHGHGPTPCACNQQSMNAVPWILGAALVVLGLNWLARRRKAAARHPGPDALPAKAEGDGPRGGQV